MKNKKLISFAIAILAAFSLCSCGNADSASDETTVAVITPTNSEEASTAVADEAETVADETKDETKDDTNASTQWFTIEGTVLVDCDEEAYGEIIIPDGITVIDSYAFETCYKITSISFPDSLTEIGDKAFMKCMGLESITIPDSVFYIGDDAFSYCDSLTSVTIPNNGIFIASNAFSNSKNVLISFNGKTYTYDELSDFDYDLYKATSE